MTGTANANDIQKVSLKSSSVDIPQPQDFEKIRLNLQDKGTLKPEQLLEQWGQMSLAMGKYRAISALTPGLASSAWDMPKTFSTGMSICREV